MGFGYRFWLLCLHLTVLPYASLTENELFLNNLHKTTGAHVRNVTELREKLNNVVRMGPSRLLIVTDYDKTITDASEGKLPLDSFATLTICPSIPQTYRDAATEMYEWYRRIITNESSTLAETSKQLTEQYKSRADNLKGIKLPRDELRDVVRNAPRNNLRQGVHKFISWTKSNDVPVMILSAGLGDAVEVTLNVNRLLEPNVKIVSNFLKLDEGDLINGWKTDIIHNYNKKEALLRDEYAGTIRGRNNAIVMGDALWDANMTDSINFDNTIKVGFLNYKNNNTLQMYLDVFDIVLENDRTMNVVNAMLNVIK